MSFEILRGGLIRGDTVGAVMARNHGAGPGFQFLRYALSIAVLLSHLSWLVGTSAHDAVLPAHNMVGQAGATYDAHNQWFSGLSDWKGMMREILVPAFFALSGFLVTGSALRVRRVPTFFTFRVLRIIPAVTTEVILSAFVLGPLLTTFPILQYFRDPLFWIYFLNIVAYPHYMLPGLFAQNPAQTVNGNLWTLPVEFICYLGVSVLMMTHVIYRRASLALIFVFVTVILAVGSAIPSFGTSLASASSYSLPLYFLVGMVMFHWRDHVALRIDLFAISTIASALLLSDHRLVYLAPLPVAYCTMAIGMYRVPPLRILNSGDYSYGIYLYGAPLTQALIQLFPRFKGHTAYIAIPALLVT